MVENTSKKGQTLRARQKGLLPMHPVNSGREDMKTADAFLQFSRPEEIVERALFLEDIGPRM